MRSGFSAASAVRRTKGAEIRFEEGYLVTFARPNSNPRARVDVRDVPMALAARRLGLSEARFEAASAELYARGFPRPDATTGLYDLVAIEAWMDRRSGLTSAAPARDAAAVVAGRLEAMRRGGTKA